MANINIDFTQKVVINTQQQDWIKSPMAGVLRKPLARSEDEVHITSIVEYAPQSYFSEPPHPQGEEIFVLEGVFSDQDGDYPAGTYLRNPPNSRHKPFSEPGCLIFVKLNQFDDTDCQTIRINTQQAPWLQGIGNLQVMPLHDFEGQHTALVKWPAGEHFKPHKHFGGEEILVISGTFQDEFGLYPRHTWIRSPHMSEHNPFVEEETIILVKTGHLPI
ncbi:cupin domain-containing protein [Psychromonas sp. 14N.309.X.WAT.B.A12]|uniref:cupin domain-containing protein n=1 Tax=Psychromonas sp. 14N.309.X.WAT.B.A12 TaxID=2998322 RepID=UPI0025AEE1EF|nr:cupin domain-containing protein [Psychromonas sp. 14N.309.X.WAT.B.A12]MDN2663747.1 cupin domain-containing protein [Psychromonas sp. 14N.309.X.WAT.B.A12]